MADLSAFAPLPDDARLWVHSATTPLEEETQTALADRLTTFVGRWTSHDHQVRGAVEVLHDRFLVIAAIQDDGGDISGCGKDDLARAVDEVASALSIDWVPSLHVLFRDQEGNVRSVSRRAFQARAGEGTVTPDTIVFDPSITTLGALRAGTFERPARASWHAQLLEAPAPS